MSTSWLKRLMLGMGCALLLGSFTAVITQAQPGPPEIRGDDCHSCHEAISDIWPDSSHSKIDVACLDSPSQPAESNQIKVCDNFKSVATESENSAFEMTGETCQVCHPSDPEEHPQKIMYTDTSSRLCGECHVDTYDELSHTAHDREGMACVRCHNPHDDNLRAGGIQDTCNSCHREEVHFYSFTDHAAEGLLCTDCHFQMAEDANGNSHRQHTLTVETETCAECHGQEMHYPMGDNTPPSDTASTIVEVEAEGFMVPLGDLDANSIDSEPMASSHINFIILAAIIGMLFGLVGSPWLEKWYQNRDDEDM